MDDHFSLTSASAAAVTMTPPPFGKALRSEGKGDHLVQHQSRLLASADNRVQAMIGRLKAAMSADNCVLSAAAPVGPARMPPVSYDDLAKMAADMQTTVACNANYQARDLAQHLWDLGWRSPAGNQEGFITAMLTVLALWDARNKLSLSMGATDLPTLLEGIL